ncbi:MAG TPA: carboxypeptidase regulatory-like domain-containing protein [Vicinamibacterales bacterium]|nr:carboxypeptidase regulatory-like domain-containing protein [Vicinamibacterales bacterium]
MRTFASRVVGVAWLTLWPMVASAQTSSIAGVVKDASGAVLPGVTVEATSSALIEKVRSVTTDGTGQYKIINLRPGTYTVTFTLTGFTVVKREGIELTSDFTASVNTDLRVGAVAETITVTGEPPVVDVQSITTRTIMTREVMDVMPTGRNIQAVGILIPGTQLALGGGLALSRDVGGSGGLQQSPLQYRGSPDTVQTIDGLRLNNLCANGAYSGVYWNDQSLQEFSYVTGADSAEMGQGGIRVNMVPKDGGNVFKGTAFGNYTPKSWASDNCGSPGAGQACTRSNLTGDTTFNKLNNFLTNVSVLTKNYDSSVGVGGPIVKDRLWFYTAFRYLAVNKTVADSFSNLNAQVPGRFTPYVADTSRPGVDDGWIRSVTGRLTIQASERNKVTYYHDEQDKVRKHWGIASTIPPEASAIQAVPTSFVSVSKWTRTQTNKLLFEVGLGVYDQEYQENHQPDVFAGPVPLVTIFDSSTSKFANAWNNPADHFSKLFTESVAASYVTGAHAMRFGMTVSQARWRLIQQWTGDVSQVTYNNGAPLSVTLRIPTDRRNALDADMGLYAQDHWTVQRATISAGLRFDWFKTSTMPETLPASTWNAAMTFNDCADGINNLNQGCTGRVLNWKDLSPRLGISYDLFGNGKTAVKASFARYVNGAGLDNLSRTDGANPEVTVGTTDTRNWVRCNPGQTSGCDLDGNGSPFNSAGQIQLNELAASTSTNFGKNVPSTTVTDPSVLNGWSKRGYNTEWAFSIQHQLMPRVSLNGAWFRRAFGNQTVTVDNRYSFANNSYDGPFCANALPDPNLPGGGGYQVCGLYDLKPSVFALNLPQSSTITFSDNYGGETNIYKGYEISTRMTFRRGGFVQGGITASKRIFDQCNLVDAGIVSANGAINTAAINTSEVAEIFPDGSRACHQDLPYRPDLKVSGSYTLVWDVIVSPTYQFVRGVQNGGAAPSVLATWATTPVTQTTLGRPYSANATTKSVNLMAVGANYGNDNLSQLDIRFSKRLRFSTRTLRVDFDAYNIFNSDWPYTVTNTFSTAANSAWLRPTNVLQARFFKIGAQFDF